MAVNTNYISWSQSATVVMQLDIFIMGAMISLTIRHILHGCNHRPTEMDRAQRFFTLTPGEKGHRIREKVWTNNIFEKREVQ